ncbi:MAG: acyl-CoA dehydrogenase family protein [Reyranellaceae bacterium]
MEYGLSARNLDIRERARAIAREVTAKHAAEHDRAYTVPLETMRALHRDGLIGLCIDRALGGEGTGLISGVEPQAYLLVIEELGRADMSAAHCYQVHAHTCQTISAIGTDEQKRRYLRPALERGELFSFTVSEPGRTARVNLVSEAAPDGDGYRLNGVKSFATLASVAEWNVIGVNMAGLAPADAITLMMVPRGARGLEIDEAWWRPTGMRGAVSPKLDLKDLYVPAADVLREPGFYPKSQIGSRWHLGFAANHLGAAQGLLDFAVDYLPQRGTANNPHAQRALGEMRLNIAASRHLLYRAAEMWAGAGEPGKEVYSLMAKSHAIATAEWMANEIIRITGSSALLESHPLHRMIRDIHVHSTHANLHNTAQTIGRDLLALEIDVTQQQ